MKTKSEIIFEKFAALYKPRPFPKPPIKITVSEKFKPYHDHWNDILTSIKTTDDPNKYIAGAAIGSGLYAGGTLLHYFLKNRALKAKLAEEAQQKETLFKLLSLGGGFGAGYLGNEFLKNK